uniref:Uncharacterized protein n=1 Tax=Ixodes ricinus TaxID=34613 RepID=A0A6B0URE4_IXORI
MREEGLTVFAALVPVPGRGLSVQRGRATRALLGAVMAQGVSRGVRTPGAAGAAGLGRQREPGKGAVEKGPRKGGAEPGKLVARGQGQLRESRQFLVVDGKRLADLLVGAVVLLLPEALFHALAHQLG